MCLGDVASAFQAMKNCLFTNEEKAAKEKQNKNKSRKQLQEVSTEKGNFCEIGYHFILSSCTVNEMGITCSTYVGEEKYIQGLEGKPLRNKTNLEDLEKYGRMILK